NNPSLLPGMTPQHQTVITEGAIEATFQPGEILFREGEPASAFYLLESGEVALEAHELADGTALVQTLGARAALGGSWLLPPFGWHLRARALEPSRAVVLNAGHLLAAAERDRDFGYELMRRVAQVLIHRLQATRQQLLSREVESALER